MNSAITEHEIISGLKKGELTALSSVYELYFRRLQYFAYSLVKDMEVARDCTVDAYIKLQTRPPEVDSLDKLRGFLFTLVRNSCLNHIKIEKRHRESKADLIGLMENPKTAELAIYEAEVLAAIYEEIEQLPAQCRQIVKATFIEGKNVEMIAQEMGLAAQTVRNQKNRGIKLVKNSLIRNNLLSSAALCIALNLLNTQ